MSARPPPTATHRTHVLAPCFPLCKAGDQDTFLQHKARPAPPTRIEEGPAQQPKGNAVTIDTAIPAHGLMLDAISRIRTLIVEHRDELAPLNVTIGPKGYLQIQVPAADTFDEGTRRGCVDKIAQILHLPTPAVSDNVPNYASRAGDYSIVVFTPIRHGNCPSCGKPVLP